MVKYKQAIRQQQPTNCLSMFDHFVGLALKGLSMEEAKSNNGITNYIPHHGVLNLHKPGKARVVFSASAKFHNISLNNNPLPVVDFLNNLISVLLRFREGVPSGQSAFERY